MKCIKCGNEVKDGDKFCPVCGNRLDIQVKQEQVTGNDFNNINNNYAATNINYYNNNLCDEELLDAYIGKNRVEMKPDSFSFCFFFIGPVYAAYRKMYMLTFITIMINLIAQTFLGFISYLIIIAINVLIASKFKREYEKHCKNKIMSIIQNNPGKPKEELIRICKEKGGTSVGAVILTLLIVTGIPLMLIYIIFTNLFYPNNNYVEPLKEYEEKIHLEDLSFRIPSTFRKSEYSNMNRTLYKLRTEDDECTVEVNITNAIEGENLEEYLYKNSDIVSGTEITKKEILNINGATFYKNELDKGYLKQTNYVTTKGKYSYLLKFKILKDKNKCSDAKRLVEESLMVK